MLSDFVRKIQTAWLRKTAPVQDCHIALVVAADPVLTNSTSHIRQNKMGNMNTSFQMSNYSKRNIRVFITNTALEIDAFIAPESADDDKSWRKHLRELPKDKKFCFKKEPKSVHVPAAQTQAVQWEPGNFVSIFVEGEDDENICTKLIIRNMELGGPHPVLLYDV